MRSQNSFLSRRPIIVAGCARSGTTLVRAILDTHENLVCGPESFILVLDTELKCQHIALNFGFDIALIEDLVQTYRNNRFHLAKVFFRMYAERIAEETGKCILAWCEKTPANIRFLPEIIDGLEPYIVHVIRDGRDVITSTYRGIARYVAIDRWVESIEAGIEHRWYQHYTEVKYEDLVRFPQPTLQKLFDFLHLPYHDYLLEFHKTRTPSRIGEHLHERGHLLPIYVSQAGRWMRTAEDEAFVRNVFGQSSKAVRLLTLLGYDDGEWLRD